MAVPACSEAMPSHCRPASAPSPLPSRALTSRGVGTGQSMGETVSVPRVSQSAFLRNVRMISAMPRVAIAR